MEKIKTFEKKIVCFLPSEKPEEHTPFREMLRFWEIYDKLYHTNHAEIIKTIYLNPNNFSQTEIYKCFKVHVSERTLIRYRQKYMQSYLACLELFIESRS